MTSKCLNFTEKSVKFCSNFLILNIIKVKLFTLSLYILKFSSDMYIISCKFRLILRTFPVKATCKCHVQIFNISLIYFDFLLKKLAAFSFLLKKLALENCIGFLSLAVLYKIYFMLVILLETDNIIHFPLFPCRVFGG